MKKIVKLVLTSIAAFALFSCTDTNDTKTSSSSSSSIAEPSSSSVLENSYHVTFLNDDNSKLYEIDVKEGQEAVYSGATPTKAEDDEFTYEFQGWDKEEELKAVASDITTKAVFKAVAKENWGSIIWF